MVLQLVLVSGTAIAVPLVRVIRTPQNGSVPDAERGGDGTVHVAYVAGDDLFYVRSINNGDSFSDPLRINSNPGTVHPPGMFRGPDLTLGKDETVHVIWYANSYQRKRPNDEWGVYYSRMVRTNTAFSPALNLNHRPSDNYSLAADPRGNVAVFWMADGLYLNMSTDNGATFTPAEKVTLADTCECCASRAFFGRDGTLFCAYRDRANNQRDMYLLARLSRDDDWTRTKASGTPWIINACPMTGTYLAGASDGLAMAWETKGIVSASRFNAQGQKEGKEIIMSGSGGKYPVVLVAPEGIMCLSWKKGSTLEWRLVDADGRPWGEPASQPSSNSHRHAGVVTKTGDFLLID